MVFHASYEKPKNTMNLGFLDRHLGPPDPDVLADRRALAERERTIEFARARGWIRDGADVTPQRIKSSKRSDLAKLPGRVEKSLRKYPETTNQQHADACVTPVTLQTKRSAGMVSPVKEKVSMSKSAKPVFYNRRQLADAIAATPMRVLRAHERGEIPVDGFLSDGAPLFLANRLTEIARIIKRPEVLA